MKINVAQRVVVMGNEGSVRDQLVSALSELGVTPIWVGKPKQSNPEQLAVLNPNRVVVSLEPSIELELEPYSDFLSQQTLTVLYDDAETTRALSGWDLNRWARHMAAKLLNKEVLPATSYEAESSDDDISASLLSWDDSDKTELSELSTEAVIGINIPDNIVRHSAWQDTQHYDTLEINTDELTMAIERMNASLAADANQHEEYCQDTDIVALSATPELEVSFELNQQLLSEHSTEFVVEDSSIQKVPNFIANAFDDVSLEDSQTSVQDSLTAPLISSFSEPIELSIQAESEYETIISGLSNQSDHIPSYDLSKFTLLDEAQESVLIDDASNTEHKVTSLWVVLSGIGGTVALREMLSKVKADFKGLIVIAHDLDSSQLPKLCVQLQKISEIPVVMLESEEFLKNAHIYLLKNSQTIQNTELGYQCIEGNSLSGFIQQIVHNVEIVILSGASTLLSQSLMQDSALLKKIHVQSPDDCFEPTLAKQLVNIGAPVMSQHLLEQWFN